MLKKGIDLKGQIDYNKELASTSQSFDKNTNPSIIANYELNKEKAVDNKFPVASKHYYILYEETRRRNRIAFNTGT